MGPAPRGVGSTMRTLPSGTTLAPPGWTDWRALARTCSISAEAASLTDLPPCDAERPPSSPPFLPSTPRSKLNVIFFSQT